MGRPTRRDYPGAIHHVMNRGVDRQPVFFSDIDRVDFGRQLATMHERFGIEFLAYCLMGNHYHLMVRSHEANLAEAMQFLGVTYTRHANDRAGRDGPLFRGRYHALLVESELYLLWATRYIHRNPLDLREIDALERYRWSSFRSYLGLRSAPPFLDTRTVTDLAGGTAALARLTADSFVLAPSWRTADIRQLISFAIYDDDLRFDGDAARQRLERTVTVLVADRLPNRAHAADLRASVAFPSREAERVAIRRARHRADEPAIKRIVGHIVSTIRLADVA